jgi:hypothetical protein
MSCSTLKTVKSKRKCSFQQGVKQGVDIILNRNEVVLDEGMYDQGVPCGTHIRRYDCERSRKRSPTAQIKRPSAKESGMNTDSLFSKG